jgi:hypothetical protein
VRHQDHQHLGHRDEEQNQDVRQGHLGHRDEDHQDHLDEDHQGRHVDHQDQDGYQDQDVRQDLDGNHLGHLDDCQELPDHLVVAGWGDQKQTSGLEVEERDVHQELRPDHEVAYRGASLEACLEEDESTVQDAPMASD